MDVFSPIPTSSDLAVFTSDTREMSAKVFGSPIELEELRVKLVNALEKTAKPAGWVFVTGLDIGARVPAVRRHFANGIPPFL